MAENPYLRLIEQDQAQERARLEISLEAGRQTPAEQTAQAFEVSRETGVPVDIAQRTEVPRKNPYLDEIDRNPRLREWLSNPVNASLAQGEEGELSWLERQMRDIPVGYQRGKDMIALSEYRMPDLYSQIGLAAPLTPEQQRKADELGRSIKESSTADIRLDNIYEWAIPQVAEQMPIMGNLMATTGKWAAGGAAFGGTVGSAMPGVGTVAGTGVGATAGMYTGLFKGAFELEAALAWDELRQIPGVDQEEAAYAALAVGGVNGLLEMAFGPEAMIAPALNGVRRLFQRKAVSAAIKSPTIRAIVAKIGKVVAGNVIGEGSTEFLQEATPDLAKTILEMGQESEKTGNPITYQAFAERLFGPNWENVEKWGKAGLAGGVTGGIMGGAMYTPTAVSDVVDYRRAKATERALLEMGDRLQKTRSGAEYVGQASQDNIYIDKVDWDTYWQSQGVDPEQAAVEVYGSAEEYKSASEADHQLVVPLSKYARTIGKSDANKYFSTVARVEPDEWNAREAETYIKEQMQAKGEELQKMETARGQILEEETQRLMAAGYSRETAETNAQQFASSLVTTAARLGKDPLQIYQERGLGVGRYEMTPEGEIIRQLGPEREVTGELVTDGGPQIVSLKDSSKFLIGSYAIEAGKGFTANHEVALPDLLRVRSALEERLSSGFEKFPDVVQNAIQEIDSLTRTMEAKQPYQTGKPVTVRVFHGARSARIAEEGFRNDMLGTNTGAPSARMGHFFAGRPETSNTYAGRTPGFEEPMWTATTEEQNAKMVEHILATRMDMLEKMVKPSKWREGGWSFFNDKGLSWDRDTKEEAIQAQADMLLGNKEFFQEIYKEVFPDSAMPEPVSEAPVVYPARLHFNNPYVHDYKGAEYREQSYASIIAKAKKAGHDGVILLNTYDGGPLDNIFVAFDDNQIEQRLYQGAQQDLSQTYAAENRVGVTVGGKPGQFDWSFTTSNTPPPIEIPTQKGPRLNVIGEKVAEILNSENFGNLIEAAFGIKGVKIARIEGSWNGNPEPSYFVTSDDMTFEQASALSKLLGFAFAQEAVVVAQPYHPGDAEGTPAFYIGSESTLTPEQLSTAKDAAIAAGLDYSTSADGRALKFLYFGDRAGLEEYGVKVAEVADAAGLPLRDLFNVNSELNYADSYLEDRERGVSGPAWIQDSAAGSPDLFRAVVDNLIVPYARAVGAEGYRFDAARFAERFGLPRHKQQLIEEALRPKEGLARSTAPILYGDEKLEVIPSGHRGQPTVTDVLWALQNRAAETGQIAPGDYSDEAKKVISETIADEVIAHITREGGKSAIGWYDKALRKAKNLYVKLFPRIKSSKENGMMFDAFLGIASQGNDVFSNSIYAARMFDLVAVQGKSIPEAVKQLKGSFGGETVAIENNYLKFDALVKQNGPIRIRRLFNEKKTVSEWNAQLRKDKRLHFNGKPLQVEGAAEQMVTGWMVFGPKIGSFINNLHGDYSTLTADLWFSRTWNRILGFSFVYKSGLEASNYQSFVEALMAEVYRDPRPRAKNGKPMMKKGKPQYWQHGSDTAGMTLQDIELILTDPEVALDFAQQLEERFRNGGYKQKSDLRRAAKVWVELRSNSVAAPRGDVERHFQQQTMEAAQALVKEKTGIDITIADMQAALWYHEKELFGHLGVKDKRSEPADYADAAKETVDSYNAGTLFDKAAEKKLKLQKQKSVEILNQDENQPRGFLSIDRSQSPARLNIGLLQKADLSTFLHESGHAYLEIMRDFSRELMARQAAGETLNELEQRYLEDGKTLLKWMGVESWDDVKVDQHEQFARGFEAYLREGNAPSIALRQAFHRFRIWLTQIYKRLTSLNVTLNDDVRGVMDRMLATDEEISAARHELELRPMFADALAAGMSEAQFENYKKVAELANIEAIERLQSSMFNEWAREQRAWWKEELDRVRGEVEKELLATRPYRAIRAMLSPEEGAPQVRISRDAIRDRYDEATLAALQKHKIVRVSDSVDPDEVAQFYGYGSGDEMVQELASTPTLASETNRIAQERMAADHGDMMRDAGQRAEEARQAALNDRQEQVLEAELKAINRLQRTAAPMLKTAAREQAEAQRQGVATLRGVPGLAVFKQIAEGRISAMKVRDLKPQVYLVAMRKAGKMAEEALAKKDYVTAAVHKQSQMLNLQLYLGAVKARAEADKQAKYARSFTRPTIRQRLGKTAYLDQIDQILERFEFKQISLKEVDNRKSLQEFVEYLKASGQVATIEAFDPRVVDQAYKKSYKDMTVDELTAVTDALKLIDGASRHKNRMLKAIDKLEFDELKAKLIESAQEKGNQAGLLDPEGGNPQNVAGQAVSAFVALHRKPSYFIRLLDGFKENGYWHRNLLRILNDASNRETTLKSETSEKLNAILAPYQTLSQKLGMKASKATFGKVQTDFFRKIYAPELKTRRYSGNVSKANLLMIALNLGNEGNKQRLLDGFGWDEAKVMQVLDRHLTREDWAAVEETWKLINSFWPEISAMHQRVFGVAPQKVEGIPVKTKYGVIQGAYFPIKYDQKRGTSQFFMSNENAADQMMAGGGFMAQTKSGHRQARAEGPIKGQQISLDIDNIAIHLNNVIHDLTHYEAVMDVNRILRDGDIKSELERLYGPEVNAQLKKWVDDAAGGDRVIMTQAERTLLWFRTGVSIASLGFNIATAAIQTTGYSQSIVRLRPAWAWAGFKAFYSNPIEMSKEILGKSEFMRNRGKTLTLEINDALNTIKGGSKMTAAAFALIGKMQQTVDFPTWQGAYLKAQAAGMNEADTISTADQAVRDTQMGGQVGDTSAIMRSNGMVRMLTVFMSYMNTTFNLASESFNRTDFTKPREIGLFVGDMLLLYTIPSVLGMMIKDALTPGDDDDDDFLTRSLRDQASMVLGQFIGLRELSGWVQGYGQYQGPAGFRIFGDTIKFATQISQGEVDQPFLRSANQVGGILFHYPALQVDRTVRGMVAIAEGETDNPLALVAGPPRNN